jgi:hypothetical protein
MLLTLNSLLLTLTLKQTTKTNWEGNTATGVITFTWSLIEKRKHLRKREEIHCNLPVEKWIFHNDYPVCYDDSDWCVLFLQIISSCMTCYFFSGILHSKILFFVEWVINMSGHIMINIYQSIWPGNGQLSVLEKMYWLVYVQHQMNIFRVPHRPDVSEVATNCSELQHRGSSHRCQWLIPWFTSKDSTQQVLVEILQDVGAW